MEARNMGNIPANYVEKCYAGWLGKVIGVRHGTLVEGWTYEQIRDSVGEITDYLTNYRDYASDDDLNGPLFFLRALEDYECSDRLTAREIGLTWLNYTPYEHGFYWWGGYGVSTEHTAYLNLWRGMDAPESGSMATNGKTVAEQIGGQIFIDGWGLACPGNPALAAKLAGRAASVSHDGNAVYGGQFVAVCISLAFVEKDIRTVMEKALAYIPEDCEYARVVRAVMAYRDEHPRADWREAMEYLIANWGYDKYPGSCHVIPNSGAMALAMLWGNGDFSRTINIGNMCGWDTDCNVGNIATIVGTLVGLEGIDPKWSEPVHDFLVTSCTLGSMNLTNLPECVRFICRTGYRLAGEEPPAEWRDFVCGKDTFDFALRGSTCSFRTEKTKAAQEDMLRHDARFFSTGRGSLRVTLLDQDAGEARNVFYKTYYHPEDFHDSRYDPFFSPVLYPGQTVCARVGLDEKSTPVAVYLFADGHGCAWEGEKTVLQPGKWIDLSLVLSGQPGGRVERVGVRVEGLTYAYINRLYIDHMNLGGRTDYRLDFTRETEENWAKTHTWLRPHREITQLARHRGVWTLENGVLYGQNGEAYTGNVTWRDVEAVCRFAPGQNGGFLFRVQGAIRAYGVFRDGECWSLRKNERGWREVARAEKTNGAQQTLRVRCVGNTITVADALGKTLMSYTDAAEKPYLYGAVGFAAGEEQSAFHSVELREVAE